MATGSADETVVIGAGLGGLTAGAKLARDGHRVLVLEQHAIPGGCATTFERRDFEFDVSLHEIEGLDDHDVKRPIFEELGVFDALSFEPIAEFYRYSHGERDLTVPHGVDDAIDHLVEQFPHEADGIRRFFAVIDTLRESMSGLPTGGDLSLSSLVTFPLRNRTFFRYRNATLGEFLDDLFDDEEVKLLLTANLGYYHDDPYSLSLPYFAVAQGGYFAGGGHYVEGGSQALSDHLADQVEAHGGTVATERQVTDVLVEDESAVGVRHERSRPGTQSSTGEEVRTVRADAVVANAPIPVVAEDLLPPAPGERLAAQIADWDLAPSLSTLYLGFETPPCQLGCDNYSTMLLPGDAESITEAVDAQQGSYGERPLSVVDYSQIEAGLTPDGKAVAAVSTLDYLDDWTGLTNAEYRRKKSFVTDVLLRRVGERYPRLPDAVEHAELATPKTIQRYTLNPGGTAYGFAQTPDQSLLNRRIDPPVSHLEFASAWTFPGGGFTGAVVAGYRAATAIERTDG